MKYKKVITLLAVLAFCFTLTGCSAKLEDFEEQVKKFDNIIDEETIYNEDYKISYSQTFKTSNDDDSIDYTYIKDGNKIYANEFIGENINIKVWYTPDQENEYIRAREFYSNGDIDKKYYIYDEETALNDMKDTKNRMLEKIYAELKDAISECKLDDDDCEVSKKAFSKKYTFEAEIDGEGEEKKVVTAVIEDGRLISFEMVEKSINKNLNELVTSTIKANITYENQTIDFKRTNDFSLAE